MFFLLWNKIARLGNLNNWCQLCQLCPWTSPLSCGCHSLTSIWHVSWTSSKIFMFQLLYRVGSLSCLFSHHWPLGKKEKSTSITSNTVLCTKARRERSSLKPNSSSTSCCTIITKSTFLSIHNWVKSNLNTEACFVAFCHWCHSV